MKTVRRKRLVFRLLLFVLPLVLLSVMMTGLVLCWTNYRHFMQTIDQDYRNIISVAAGQIEFYLDSARNDLESLGRVLSAAKMDEWQETMALRAFNQKSSIFMHIALLSPRREEIVRSGWTENDHSTGHEDLFRQAVQGRFSFSAVYLTKDRIPYAILTVPVFHLGEVSAVLWGEVSLKAVWDVVKGIRIGKTGEVYLMTLEGQVLGDSDMVHVVKPPSMTHPDVLGRLRQSQRAPVLWVEDRDGDTFQHLGRIIPFPQWAIVLSQTDDEIHAYLYRNLRWALAIVLLVCTLAALSGWVLVRRFLRPIHDLHEQVLRIGQGDLDHPVNIEEQDEIGELGVAFNKMTESLKGYIQREIETAREMAHARNLALLGTAASKVTHEVGNLLSNIALSLRNLKREQLGPRGTTSIEMLEKEASRVRSFIQDFLQFAKKPVLKLQKVDLDEMLREVVAFHRPEACGRGVDLECEGLSGLPPIPADARLLYQLFNNLIKNSLDAMTEPGVIRIEGTMEAAEVGDMLRVSLIDTGSGIAPADLQRIFEPFFTTKSNHGTGLGLPICRTIVESHRGSIECHSTQGQGTTFILRFPLQ